MPRATNNLQETQRKELKSLPARDSEEGGYIVARRLSYGEKLQRREMVSNMKIKSEKGKKDFDGEMQLINEKATLYDIQHCIVEHNLTGEDDQPLDLTNARVVRTLDPRVGEEISDFLDSINNFEEDDEEGN